jgi:hypothetical protein
MVFVGRKRTDITEDEFITYWQQIHAPLAPGWAIKNEQHVLSEFGHVGGISQARPPVTALMPLIANVVVPVNIVACEPRGRHLSNGWNRAGSAADTRERSSRQRESCGGTARATTLT